MDQRGSGGDIEKDYDPVCILKVDMIGLPVD